MTSPVAAYALGFATGFGVWLIAVAFVRAELRARGRS